MAKKCKLCERTVFSKGYCLFHTPKKPLKKSNKPLKKGNNKLKKTWLSKEPLEKQKAKKALKTENTKKLHEWFVSLFIKRMNINGFVVCFETGKPMHEDFYMENSCIYSHYFPKSTFPQYTFEEWNLEIVTPDTHAQWEANPEKCPKMYEKYQKLKKIYGK